MTIPKKQLTGVLETGSTVVSSTPYVVLDSDVALFCDAGAAAITLPAIATFGERALRISNRAAAGTVTITPDGAETVLLGATLELTAVGESVVLWPQGTDWGVF